ncbi:MULTISPECIES: NAD(+) diphosphatase [Bifidobacterium]|uniref:NAD(+) diphosphatase n=1 Tax=Bifidobacterium reuteri DSM 23975 TaxID=1437610 RepID=A0A087CXL4_9BIFI|nr:MULTISPECIES: NAD(+) diphosphatase [Bifidobacterium]KFI88014.1 NUDIX family hydrolase [Bifidobacterium reuteri DSM 23975]TPF78544.1 NADH pyrophosphatase [Bifidobacterium sp. UTCIF-1]TPF80824.1 NADH pyrophosphatase [Bifidobacterium sp. UTCIF-24]TPF82736.1 NADH pyrophosphatase [Bifidobacterium sp. UTCIF-3]TPF84491.1 NADH pyrophosphatase [Bifidobacterium sp. UTCIF-36]
MTADIHFSPLALTRALPFLPLAQGDIDYQVDRRGEPGLIGHLLEDPATKVILTRNGLVAVPRGQGELVDYENVKLRLATLPGAYVAAELKRYPQAVAMFLGSYGGVRGECVVAIDISRVPEPGAVNRAAGAPDAVGAAAGASSSAVGNPAGASTPGIVGVLGTEDSGTVDGNLSVSDSAGQGADDAFDESVGIAGEQPRQPKPTLLQQAVDRFDWADLRGFAPHANAREAGQATSAVTLSIWHSRQRYCPTCGAPVETALAGWAQRCSNAADGNRILFPRIEPAVITAIVDGHDRLLLQHNAAWKDERLYSVSAGFVEAGENLEHAARREAKEETGITLGEVRYLGSQPWPFPASLMMAFKAHAVTTDVHVDGSETVTARWVTRDEYTAELISGRMAAPGRATIARYMIEEWLGREL